MPIYTVAEQVGGGGGVIGPHLYRGLNFARKCIPTTPIRAPIYIWPQAAIPPAPPLHTHKLQYNKDLCHLNSGGAGGGEYCHPGPNIYGRPYWCSRNTFAREIAAPSSPPLLRHCISIYI